MLRYLLRRVLMAVPILVGFVIFQREFMRGMLTSAVKG